MQHVELPLFILMDEHRAEDQGPGIALPRDHSRSRRRLKWRTSSMTASALACLPAWDQHLTHLLQVCSMGFGVFHGLDQLSRRSARLFHRSS